MISLLEKTTLQIGAKLRYPLKDQNGVLLLAPGAIVTDRLCKLLKHRGVSLGIQACLKLIRGGTPGLEIPLQKSEFVIGRRPDCDVQLTGSVVSGHHCQLIKRQLDIFLVDLNSRNGTFLNEKKVEVECPVHDQDILRIGTSEFCINIFASFNATNEESSKAVHAWIVTESLSRRNAASPYSPTFPELDLDNEPN